MDTDSSCLIQCSAALGALMVVFYVAPYLLDPYNYRHRFPGPPLAGFTNWWMYRVVRAGNHSEIVKQLHAKYGTFVRLGPNHISISDPDALETVYGHGSGVLKSDFYHSFRNGPNTNTFNTQDKAEHSKKRRRLANAFSPQNVLDFQPRVRNLIWQLCVQWDLRCEEAARGTSGPNWVANNGRATMNVCAQFSYLAFDIIGDLALGSPFGLIQAQTDSSPSIESIDASGQPVRGTMRVPVIETIAGAAFTGMTYGGRGIDLVDKLLEAKNDDGSPLSANELYAEAVMLLVAGSDTTSNTLSSLCYHLAIHPEVQRELQAELDLHVPYDSSEETSGKAPPNDAVVYYEMIKNLPYLDACIKEALRIHSTVGTGMPRTVPSGKTITVAGQTFEAGSVISVPSYTTNRSSVWGNDASDFRPGRWLEDGAGTLNKYFVPFSIGPRACIGRNLAYMDLMLIVATLFRRYQVEALPTTKIVIREAFARQTAKCEVSIRRRSVP
ncbi:cytochrome P450 family protein [Rhizoctonia solani]|uniref:Cytochrome P450 family protein n=1 Tax=Rhizoctonia solani TaxID=456999 RepID=A0A8H8T025_9AGAM|nr:cytochrome P450 family protein [Rhizoctonia solani]QRW24239.1 cytochrome P450 family protein [Rhizoctonia solani]